MHLGRFVIKVSIITFDPFSLSYFVNTSRCYLRVNRNMSVDAVQVAPVKGRAVTRGAARTRLKSGCNRPDAAHVELMPCNQAQILEQGAGLSVSLDLVSEEFLQ